MISRLRTLVRRLAALRHRGPMPLEVWIEHHRKVIERDVAEVLHHIPEGATFLDVGANCGLFTEAVLAARPGSRAFLFEPMRRYYDHCVERFRGNDLVSVHHTGLSSTEEELTIYLTPNNYGGNSVVRELMYDPRETPLVPHGTVLKEDRVRCRPFHVLAQELGIEQVDFIKTDTEGYDHAVLRGMLPFLRKTPRLPVILSELLREDFHPFRAQQREVIDAITALGYHPIDMSQMTERVGDYVFVPLDRGGP